jgi:hypothetical protein
MDEQERRGDEPGHAELRFPFEADAALGDPARGPLLAGEAAA